MMRGTKIESETKQLIQKWRMGKEREGERKNTSKKRRLGEKEKPPQQQS